jgi:hypothetical protein
LFNFHHIEAVDATTLTTLPTTFLAMIEVSFENMSLIDDGRKHRIARDIFLFVLFNKDSKECFAANPRE